MDAPYSIVGVNFRTIVQAIPRRIRKDDRSMNEQFPASQKAGRFKLSIFLSLLETHLCPFQGSDYISVRPKKGMRK
jgi:hypothetical protein